MSASKHPAPRAARLRVLLVEDESMVALLLEGMLAELGHEVVGPVARLDQALEMAQQQKLDAALLDVDLNGKEIYPVAEALDAREIPFVFITGYGRNVLRAPYCNRPTLQKPFRRGALREIFAGVRLTKPTNLAAPIKL
jgi:CheY-like chemotaxis protein